MQDLTLELATVEQIAQELERRRLEFALVCMPQRPNDSGMVAVNSFRAPWLLVSAANYVWQFPIGDN